jgi:hypothetical protein
MVLPIHNHAVGLYSLSYGTVLYGITVHIHKAFYVAGLCIVQAIRL